MKEILKQLKLIVDRLNKVEASMATKDELAEMRKVMATKDDLKSLASKHDLTSFRTEMEERFDGVTDVLQQILGDAGELSEREAGKVRKDLAPKIEKLEQIHPDGQHSVF